MLIGHHPDMPKILGISGLPFHSDKRGEFFEINSPRIREILDLEQALPQQVNLVHQNQHTVRGFHGTYNVPGAYKAFRLISGSAQLHVLNIQPDSKDYGTACVFMMNQFSHQLVYVPDGYATALHTNSSDVLMTYFTGAAHDPEQEVRINPHTAGLRYVAPAFDGPFDLNSAQNISTADQQAKHLDEHREDWLNMKHKTEAMLAGPPKEVKPDEDWVDPVDVGEKTK